MPGQAQIGAAILDPAAGVPEGLTGPDGSTAGKRFDVYRNNVAVSLTEALQDGFPVIRKLVGDDFFRAMAGVYLRRHPPRCPRLMLYGQDMPNFLETFPPAAGLPYLPDIARLELAIRRAYHAADAAPIDAQRLAALPPDILPTARLGLAPSVAVVTSAWPVHAIWLANIRAGAPKPEDGAQAVVVTRPEYDPELDPVAAAAARFVVAVLGGARLGAAYDAALAEDVGLDLGAVLSLLLARRAVTDLELEERG